MPVRETIKSKANTTGPGGKSKAVAKNSKKDQPKKDNGSKKGKSKKENSSLPKPLRKIANYFSKSISEFKKVVWPSRKEAWQLTFAVIVFSAVFTVVIIFVDYIYKNIIERYVI